MDRREFGALVCAAIAASGSRSLASPSSGGLPQPPPMTCAPLQETRALGRICFGSCYVPQFEEGQVWNAISDSGPDAFLFIGDNVYQSEENGCPELLELREAYASLAADKWFAALRAKTPVLVTWDDHDYGMNDAGAEFPARRETEALFKQVWAVEEGDPRASREGVYHARTAGPAGRRTQMILLDERYFRTPETMLGEAQWAWLEAVLKEPADLRILASSIPLLMRSDLGESWNHWPDERRRLFELIGRTGAEGVVIVSGDSHFGAQYRCEEGPAYPLVELTSSSLNFPMPEKAQSPPGPADPARIGAVFYPANFGAVEVDWAAGRVGLVLRDAGGRTVSRQDVRLKDLRAS